MRNQAGFGMTISYWTSLESINEWRHNLSHMEANQNGKDKWYSEYMLRICKVEMDNYFKSPK